MPFGIYPIENNPLYFSVWGIFRLIAILQWKGGIISMSKMLRVTPNDDYTLLVEFEHGNKIIFNMQDMIKTIPYSSLKNLSRFRNITLKEKAICWPDPIPGKSTMLPIRLTVDNILFSIRE